MKDKLQHAMKPTPERFRYAVQMAVDEAVTQPSPKKRLSKGWRVAIAIIILAALIPSANEACNVMAEAVAGDVASFVDLMNQRAAELGMTDTHFANTHGYHDDNHYTSAYDVFLMCQEAMKHETFRTIVSSKSYDMPATNMHPEVRTVHSTNALISNWNVAG